MRNTVYNSILTQLESQDAISAKLFGVNSVATVNMPQQGGVHDRLLDVIRPEHMRYPGGTVTEELLDPRTAVWDKFIAPDAPAFQTLENGQEIQSLKQVVSYAAQNGQNLTLVLPSDFLLHSGPVGSRQPDELLISKVIDDLQRFYEANPAAVRIQTVEIGNEYYYNGRMTAAEYGKIADRLAVNLDRMYAELARDLPWIHEGNEPDIAVQAGAGWQPGDNATIINSLSQEAKGAIDQVVAHFYPRGMANIANFDRNMGGIEEWEADPALADVDFYVSEWNIQNRSISDKGFMQASALPSVFDQMLRYDVDIASFWGTQYNSLDSRLASMSRRDSNLADQDRIDTDLTSAGEMFLTMRQNLIGLKSLPISDGVLFQPSRLPGDSTQTDPAFVGNYYGAKDRAFLIYSSREASKASLVNVSLGRIFTEAQHVSVRILKPVDNPDTTVNEANPTLAAARADIDYLYTGPLSGVPGTIEVPPGAILLVNVQLSPEGVELEGQNPISAESFIDSADLINGSNYGDTIRGHSGNDTLDGKAGNDILIGGAGSDRMMGGSGNDLLIDTEGNPVAFGGDGHDVITTEGQRSNVVAHSGNDLIIDRSDSAVLHANEGDDTVLVLGSSTVVHGGDGADLFFFGGEGQHRITDFNASAGDRIHIGSAVTGEAPDASAFSVVSHDASKAEVTVQLSENSTLTVQGWTQAPENILDQLNVGSQDPVVTGRIAQSLGNMSHDQVKVLFENLGTEQLAGLFDAADPAGLFNALSPDKAMGMVLGLEQEELAGVMEAVGSDAFMAKLKNLSPEVAGKFLEDVSYDQFAAVLSMSGQSAVTSWFDGLQNAQKLQLSAVAAEHGLGLNAPFTPPSETVLDTRSPTTTNRDLFENRFLNTDDEEEEPPEPDDAPQAREVSADCFIACTVYENPYHPDVWLLRWFRDMVLRRFWLGRQFVRLYWRLGPKMAQRVGGNPALRAVLLRLVMLLVTVIALVYRRAPGRQPDHSIWPQNPFKTIRIVGSRTKR